VTNPAGAEIWVESRMWRIEGISGGDVEEGSWESGERV
jgi:hypothetical protein